MDTFLFTLWRLGATDPSMVGPKAARLAAAAQAGFDVPPALLLSHEAQAAGMGPALQQAIAEALLAPEAPTWPLAVRSSAIAEDLAGASFAGIQETVLGITSLEALWAAIERVWGSVESGTAQAYRAHQLGAGPSEGVPTLPGGIGVILQQQVSPLAAGVAFGKDPLTGEPLTVVEAVAGLGDALMSGQSEPVTWRLRGAEIIDRPGTGEALLPDGVIRAVGALIEKSTAHFGEPQDVEWAWDGDKLWFLQTRPITTHPDDFYSQARGDDHALWTAAFLNERFTAPVSPLGWTLVSKPLAALAFGEPLRLLGVTHQPEPPLKLFQGHPYSQVLAWQQLYKLFPDWALPEDAVRYFPQGDTSLRKAPGEPRWGPHLLINGVRLLGREGQAALPWSNAAAWRAYERRHEARFAALAARVATLAALSPEPRAARGQALLREAQAEVDRLLTIHRWSLLWADLTFSLLRRLLQTLTDRATGTRLAAALTGGVRSRTALMNQAVAALAGQVRLRADLQPLLAEATTMGALEAGLGGDDPFVRALRSFLARYGHRALMLDLFDPPFAVAPAPLFAMLLSGAAHPAPRVSGGRPWDAAEVQSALPRPVRTLLVPLLKLTRAQLRLREDQRFFWQHWLALQREIVTCLGEGWATAGLLREAEDVFGLTWEELLGSSLDEALGSRARRRLEEFRRLRRQAAQAPTWHYPDFLRGSHPLRAEDRATTLRGRPVSPGIARGPARVVATAEALGRLQPGDVLVTTSPDPGWTPAFQTVAALVTERGGQLSHGAVVAREYGLPAVFGISGALGTIEDGEELLVDGTEGIVVRVGRNG